MHGGAIIHKVLRGNVGGFAAGILLLTALEAMELLPFLQLQMGCVRVKWQMTVNFKGICLLEFLRPLLKFQATIECFLGKRFSLNTHFLLTEGKWVFIVLGFEAEGIRFDWKQFFSIKYIIM